MGIDNKGGINIVVMAILFGLLLSISLMLHQLNRMTESNAMFVENNQARHLALALEQKYLIEYEQVGDSCGQINNKQFHVRVSETSDNGFRVFIVVELQKAVFTIDMVLDPQGKVISRLENVPKGELECL